MIANARESFTSEDILTTIDILYNTTYFNVGIIQHSDITKTLNQ
jgi:hypothetical protein